MEVPGVAEPTFGVTEDPWSLSVLVMPRIAWAVRLSESVAVTVEASAAEAVAVLVRVPVAEDWMAAVTVYVTVPPAGMVDESLMLPVPEAPKPVAPPDPVAVQVSEAVAGWRAIGSETVTRVAVEGPALEATTV